MSFFFIFIIIGIVVTFSIWNKRRNQLATTFTNAASRLGLRVSTDGTVMQRPWIYGEKKGVRIDVRPFTRTKDGARSTWTGYRLRFPDSIDLKISGGDDSRRKIITRLANRFSESEIESDGLFCARSAMAEDSSRIVADVEYLLSAARELRQGSAPRVEPETPAPPPLPVREKPVVPVTETRTEPEPTKNDQVSKTSPLVVDEKTLDVPTILRSKGKLVETVSKDPSGEVEVPSPVIDSVSKIEEEETPLPHLDIAPPKPVSDEDAEEEKDTGNQVSPFTPITLDVAAADLFDSGRNRFEMGQQFDAEYLEVALEGTGRLRRVERYSNDRVFGRGPGFVAEVAIRKLENPSGGLQVITAVIQLPDEEESGMSIRHWRERIGEPVIACGTLIRCDAFAGKLFLRDGLVDTAATAA